MCSLHKAAFIFKILSHKTKIRRALKTRGGFIKLLFYSQEEMQLTPYIEVITI